MFPSFRLVLFHFLFFFQNIAIGTPLPDSEYDALFSLYSSTNGLLWTYQPTDEYGNEWDFSSNSDPCQGYWQGITCSQSCFDDGNDCTVLTLILVDYNMNGKLPQDIGNLANLESLLLNNNELYGELPISLYNIINLVNLNLANNQLSGLISSDIGFLQNLRLLDLSQNQFTGELPSTIGLLKYVRHIDLSANQFFSSIPLELLSLQSLEVLLIQNNYLNSNIPDSMELLQNLRTFDVSNNNLSGEIPSSLFNLPNIKSVVFTKNCFTGSIPTAICNAKSLVSIDFDGLRAGRNCRTSIVNSYYSSYVQGRIPNCVFQLSNLALLHLSGNGLHGQLPQNVEISSSLRNVSLSYNRLSGSLPIAFQTFPFQKFDVSYNKISGTTTHVTMNLLPTDMYPELPTTRLVMQINRISGPLAAAFHTATNVNIVSGNLYDCEFISELPVNDPGTPSAVCGTQVTNISFYGLLVSLWAAFLVLCIYTLQDFGYSKTTTTTSVNFAAASSVSVRTVDGKMLNKLKKSELFSLVNTDSQDALYQEESSSSVIEAGTGSKGKLNIKTSITGNSNQNSILNNNLNISISTLVEVRQPKPRNGIFIEKIVYNFIFERKNNSHFIKMLKKHAMTKSLYLWLNIAYDVMNKKPYDLKETTRFLLLIAEIRNFFWVITIYILTINLPTYLGLRFSDSGNLNTHTYQYAYVPSIAFFIGEAPAIVIFLMILGSSILILIVMHRIQNIEPKKLKTPKVPKSRSISKSNFTSPVPTPTKSKIHSALSIPSFSRESSIEENLNILPVFLKPTTSSNNNNITGHIQKTSDGEYVNNEGDVFDNTTTRSKLMPNIWLYVIIPTINLGVTLAVNTWYVYVILYEKRQYKLMVVTLLSIFKMIWNMLIIPALMQTVKGAGPMFTQKLVMQMIIMIFNIVIAPVLINAMISPDCLQHIFFQAAALEATTQINVCDSYDIYGDCVVSYTRAVMTSYNPPFMYGFQCSSSILINYSPAFIQMYTLIAVIMPLVAVIMFSVMDLDVNDKCMSSNIFCCCWFRLAVFLKNLKTIPPIYKNASLLGNYETVGNSGEASNPINQIYGQPIEDKSDSISRSNSYFIDYEVKPEDIPSHYHNNRIRNAPKQTILNPDTIFSHLMGHIMVLITFGFAYPPLAVLITFTVSVVTCQWQVLVGRYLEQISKKEGKELKLLKIQIEVGCHGVSRRFFYKTKWLIICGMASFFILFAFDMTADESYDHPNAWLWAILIYGLYPVPLCLISWFYDYRASRINHDVVNPIQTH